MSAYNSAKKLRKTNFKPWQRYVDDMHFLYQGVLLLLSALAASVIYSVALFALLRFGEPLFVTAVQNGDIYTTVIPPVFWTAVACAIVIFVMILFARPISFLLMRLLRAGKKEEKEAEEDRSDVGSSPAVHVYTVIATVNAFYLAVLLIGLFASVVFSTVYKNGIIAFPLIFACLTFLTYFCKKLLSYPVFLLMDKRIEQEKKRRSDGYLSVSRPEGLEFADPLSRRLTREEYPEIVGTVERVLEKRGMHLKSVGVVMGDDIGIYFYTPLYAEVEIGVSALSVLKKEELEAILLYVTEHTLDSSGIAVRRRALFRRSIGFSSSSWNPLERIYMPITLYFLDESSPSAAIQKEMSASVYKRSLRNGGEAFEKSFCSGILKNVIYKNFPFAERGDFYISLLRKSEPCPNYHSRLIDLFFDYVDQNGKDILLRLEELRKEQLLGVGYSLLFLLDGICEQTEGADIVSRPSGEYGKEAESLSLHFDEIFAACAGLRYEAERELRYTKPLARIRAYERNCINRVAQETKDSLSAAADYISLNRFSQAREILSQLPTSELDSTPYAKLLLGEAKMRMGEGDGFSLIVDAVKERPILCTKALEVVNRCAVHCFDLHNSDEYKEGVQFLIGSVAKEGNEAVVLYQMNSENAVPPKNVRLDLPKGFSKDATAEIGEKVTLICGDRLEWAAFVSVSVGNTTIPKNMLIVRVSQIAPGSYTGAFDGCVYLPDTDPLLDEIRYLGELNDPPFISRVVYHASAEPFEAIEGAIICRRGVMFANDILSAEAQSFLFDTEDGDSAEIEIEQDEDEEK